LALYCYYDTQPIRSCARFIAVDNLLITQHQYAAVSSGDAKLPAEINIIILTAHHQTIQNASLWFVSHLQQASYA